MASHSSASSEVASPSPEEVQYAEVVASLPREQRTLSTKSILWRLYLSHTLSTWNSRTFEFAAVIFLGTIFPGTLFYASCYALFRSGAAAILGPWIGGVVDGNPRLWTVRQSIIWQRCPVALSCLVLIALSVQGIELSLQKLGLFALAVGLACLEKLASIMNTISIERDWIIVIAEDLHVDRQELNSTMRRIDLFCKLVAPLAISLVDGYSTRVAIWAVFGQNALSVFFEYFAIEGVFAAVTALDKEPIQTTDPDSDSGQSSPRASSLFGSKSSYLAPFRIYISDPVFMASLSLSLLYLTVLSFGAQMTTYLLTVGFNSVDISLMRLASVALELSATCAAPILMRKIGAVRSGLWFINEQLVAIILAVILFHGNDPSTKAAGTVLAIGVILSRIGLWGYDLSVQYLVQEDAPVSARGSFSAVEASLQSVFELLSFAVTMAFAKPEQFQVPVLVSAGAVGLSAVIFARFVRIKRGHLLHMKKCFRRERNGKYTEILPTIEEEEEEMDEIIRK